MSCKKRANSDEDKATANSKRRNRSVSNFDQMRCSVWYHQYVNSGTGVINGDGMLKLCEDLEVEPENAVMLVLAYKLGADKMGVFTQAEWLKGMRALKCDSAAKLKEKLEEFKTLLLDKEEFRNIYSYAYDFSKDPDLRRVHVDIGKEMLKVLLGKSWPLFPQFARFLDEKEVKVISRDQWYNILDFAWNVSPDLDGYDVDGAWPILLDEFVEWLKEKNPTVSASHENMLVDN